MAQEKRSFDCERSEQQWPAMVQRHEQAAEGQRWAGEAFLGLVEADGEGLKGGAFFFLSTPAAVGCWSFFLGCGCWLGVAGF
jgi:hypothetical protein